MHGKKGVVLATVLMIAAAGVTAYNVDFLSRWRGDTSTDAGGGPARDPSPAVDALSPPPGDAPVHSPPEEDAGGEGKGGKHRPPLGEAWAGTLWESLLRGFQARGAGRGEEEALPLPDTSPLPAGEGIRPGALKVQGILRGGTVSAVLIDGEVFRPGTVIPGTGFRVSSIEAGYVILRQRDGARTLEIPIEPRASSRSEPPLEEDTRGTPPLEHGKSPPASEPPPAGGGA